MRVRTHLSVSFGYMARHLISDAHEWMNEIPTVPIHYLAKPQSRNQRNGVFSWIGVVGITFCLGSKFVYDDINIHNFLF